MSKVCPYCDSVLPDNPKFCTVCGEDLSEVECSDEEIIPAVSEPMEEFLPEPEAKEPKVKSCKPLSTIAYVGLILLFCIPCIGFVAMILMAVLAKNLNVKHFAQAACVWLVITVILSVVGFFGLKSALKHAGNGLTHTLDTIAPYITTYLEENSSSAA